MIRPRQAADIDGGWIRVPHPAAPRGWYEITGPPTQDGGWRRFTLADRAPFTISDTTELDWSPVQPAHITR